MNTSTVSQPSVPQFNECWEALPQMWDHNVHYFANVLGMFFGNSMQTKELKEKIGGVESHGGRFAPVLNIMFQGLGDNVLYVEKSPDPILLQYFRNLGLSIPEIVVLSHEEIYNLSPEVLQKRCHSGESIWLDGYVIDENLEQLGQAVNHQLVTSYAASKSGNNKGELHEFLKANELPVFETLFANDTEEAKGCLKTLAKRGYKKGVVKSVIGASGVGMKKMSTTETEGVEIPESFFFEGPCMVQGWLDKERSGVKEVLSPSVQIFIKDEVISCFDVTEQFLSGSSIFKGNECTPSYLGWPDYTGLKAELLRQSEIVGNWLHGLGLRGPASIDFLVVNSDKLREVYVCEANARVTGATYPSLLARSLQDGGDWMMRNLKFRKPVPTRKLLRQLSDHGYLYEPGKLQGLLPYNLYTCDHGRVEQGQFLVMAPEITTCKGLLIEAERDMPIDWDYERA